MNRRLRALSFASSLIALCTCAARAEDGFVIKGWTIAPSSAEVLRDPSGEMLLTVGGAVSGRNTRSQRLTAQGLALWDSAGLAGGQNVGGLRFPAMTSDAAGGLFRASASFNSSAFLFRFLADGSQPAYGAPLFGAWDLGPSSAQSIDVAQAPAGGCYVAYQDAGSRLRLHRRSADGTPAPGWSPAGRRLGSETFADIESDDSGACWILASGLISLRLDRIRPDTTRAPGFPVGGFELTDLGSVLDWFRLIPSGDEHVIALWREVGPPHRVRARRVHRDGVFDPAWASTGTVLVPDSAADIKVLPDGEGGVHVLWVASGAPRWTRWLASGAPAPGHSVAGVLLPAGGASGYFDANSYFIEVTGAAARPGGGLLFAWTRPDQQGRLRWFESDGSLTPGEPEAGRDVPARVVALADDGSGGAHAFYSAFDPSTNYTGVKHRRILASGVVAVPPVATPARLTLASPVPHPARSSARFAVELIDERAATLTLHDVSGRAVRAVTLQGAGRHRPAFDGLERLPPGLYLARLHSGRDARVTRLVIAR